MTWGDLDGMVALPPQGPVHHASLTGNESDPTPANIPAIVTSTVIPATRSRPQCHHDSRCRRGRGTNLAYTFTITNQGPSQTTAGTLEVTLPASVVRTSYRRTVLWQERCCVVL